MHGLGHKDMFCNSQLTHETKTGNRNDGEIAAMRVNRMQSEVIRGIVQNVYFGHSHKAQRIGKVPSACCNIWKARRGRKRSEGERQVFTYIGWEGLQGGEGLLGIRGLSLGEKGLQTRAGFIHRHGAACPCRQVAFQGRGGGGGGGRGGGTGGIGVVRAAGGRIGLLSGDLPPERDVLA